MNKLQKLADSGIEFTISHFNKTDEGWWTLKVSNDFHKSGSEPYFEIAVKRLWEFAKKYYPEAECFKEENNLKIVVDNT